MYNTFGYEGGAVARACDELNRMEQRIKELCTSKEFKNEKSKKARDERLYVCNLICDDADAVLYK